MIKIGFIGQGWVGKNYADNLEKRGFKVIRHSLEKPFLQNKHKIKDCAIVFIAVPTPTTPQGFDCNILKKVIKLVSKGKIAVIKSTILPGTTKLIQQENPEIFVIYSPEFLSRSTAKYDADHPKRNIIGIPHYNALYKKKAKEVLAVLPSAPYIIVCRAENAELVKYGGNCFFYFKNVFINMLYDYSKKIGCDWETVRDMIADDPMIGEEHTRIINKGGRGAGGDCLIKDFEAFLNEYKNAVNDKTGLVILENLRNKNIKLLVDSGKDLDLLKGIYNNNFINKIIKKS